MKCVPLIGVFLLLVMFLISGCGQNMIVPVSGTVTVQGKPAANIRVTFQPVATGEGLDVAGPGALGVTDANGRYEMEIVSASQVGKGATVGSNRVYLSPSDDSSEDSLPNVPKKPLPKFPWGETEVQTMIDVPPGGTSTADFALPLANNNTK